MPKEEHPISQEEDELNAAIEAILISPSRKKLVVAGPGTGKTTLFRKLLERSTGDAHSRMVLTFINNLKDDLADDLAGFAEVFTLHSFCLGFLHKHPQLREPLSDRFQCLPGLATLIAEDWTILKGSPPPKFVAEMRSLEAGNHLDFYLERGNYYDAVDFDDSVYRVHRRVTEGTALPDVYELVLIDEYQDFNRLEASIIDLLAESSPILVTGDDDQALYSQLRDSSWEYIRQLSKEGEYEVFELPFCMRCPEVIIEAVKDVFSRAREVNRLHGRIEKSFKHYSPVKGADSEKYPRIGLVETSVQRQSANYLGRYISQEIAQIPNEEIEEALEGGYPPALVIAANPYRSQIAAQLEDDGYTIDTRRDPTERLDHTLGLSILKEDGQSNLGWRVVLRADNPPFLQDLIAGTTGTSRRIVDMLPNEYREALLGKAAAYEPPEVQAQPSLSATSSSASMPVRITSFEGAKGLSAQHVFIAGLHDNELPHDPTDIKDLEICRFIVGLTRTRKKYTLMYTKNFAGSWKTRSSFLSWIDDTRYEFIKVDADFW